MKYKIIEVDGFLRSCIDVNGKANKYGKPKLFEKRADAENGLKREAIKECLFIMK